MAPATPHPIPDFPTDLVSAVAQDAAADASRATLFLSEFGIIATPERPVYLPPGFLLDLGAALRLLCWERAGLDPQGAAGLPPARQALREVLLTAASHARDGAAEAPGTPVTEAASAADVDRTTVHRWLKSDFTFQAAFNHQRRALRRAMQARLMSLAEKAADLRRWLADRLRRLQDEARKTGDPAPSRLPPDAPVFDVPARLVKILDRDLSLAGIAERDDRVRTLDVHALRHTFGTLLSKGGVAPRTAQTAMRHSDIKLTMNVYTDPDVRGALEALPPLPLDGPKPDAMRATGTGGEPGKFAPGFAPTRYKLVQTESSPDKTAGDSHLTE